MAHCTISVATAWPDIEADGAARVFLPALARFPPETRELMGLLPVVDINGELLVALAQDRRAGAGVVAGLFAADPFLDRTATVAALRRAGFDGVANFPTLQLFEGATAAGFDVVGYNIDAELAALRTFSDAGFAVHVYVAGVAAAGAALSAGFRTLVFHPGLPPQRGERQALERIAQMTEAAGAALLLHQRDVRR